MTTDDGRVIGTTTILDHGPRAARWNLVILAEGYQEQELPDFHQHAQDFVDALRTTDPFPALEDAVNVHRVDVASDDSGADDPQGGNCQGTGATPDTYFDASFCSGGLERLLTVDTGTVMEVASDEVPEWHVAMVIVNSTEYGGSGADGVPVVSVHADADRIGLHELGHAGFGLADEYPNHVSCGISEPDHEQYGGSEPVEPNITAETDGSRVKWRALIRDGTAVPTMENPDCTQCDTRASPVPAGTVGLFEGAGYHRCGLYRPQYDCLMDEFGHPFCAVCRQRIRSTLAPFRPRREPMDYTVISRVRAHFGDQEDALPGRFAGQRDDWTFDCPGIDPGQDAVLMFQSRHVDFPTNVLTINDETVFGDVPVTGPADAWTSNVLLVSSGTLEPTGNVLHVEARDESGGTSGNLDDFVIDNLVLFYKTS